MTTQDWINKQKIEAVQDRKDGKEYWKTDNLYTESDLIELLEAFVGCPECKSTDCKTAIHTDYKECNKCYHYWEAN